MVAASRHGCLDESQATHDSDMRRCDLSQFGSLVSLLFFGSKLMQ